VVLEPFMTPANQAFFLVHSGVSSFLYLCHCFTVTRYSSVNCTVFCFMLFIPVCSFVWSSAIFSWINVESMLRSVFGSTVLVMCTREHRQALFSLIVLCACCWAQALIHVSTAYCNCDREEVTEVIYPPPYDPENIIQCMEWMDDDLIQALTPK